MSPDANLNADLAGRTPDIVGVLRRQWPVIVLCALAAAVIASLYVSSTEVSYEAKSTVLLVPLPGETAPGGGRERTLDVDTQATVARSTSLLETVGSRLGLSTSQVRGSSRVEAAPTGNVLFIFFEDDQPDFAAEGATVYTEEFLAQRKKAADDTAKRQQSLVQAQIDDLAKEVDDLTLQINAIVDDDSATTELQVLQQRQSLAIRDLSTAREEFANIDVDQNPGSVVVDPRTAVNKTGLSKPLAIGGSMIVGLLVGLIVGLLRDRRDDRYGSALGLEAVGVQEVGRLRYPGDLRVAGGRIDSTQRDYARLLVRLGFANGITNSGHRAILLVAVESTTLPHQTMRVVAQALAAQGPDNGLVTTVISPERSASLGTGADGDPSGGLARPDGIDSNASYWNQFSASLAVEMSDHDIVLVAAGAFDRSVAGLAVASKVDQTILLVSEATRVGELVAVIEDLESVDAREIGVVVLTKVPPRRKW